MNFKKEKMVNLYKQFHAFEEKYNLFDLKDNNGIYVWDALRYSVYTQICQGRKFGRVRSSESFRKRFYLYIGALLHFFFKLFLFRNRQFMFIVNPRDNIEGKLIDKILDEPLDTVGIDKCLIIDSSGENYFKPNNKYKSYGILKIEEWIRKLFVHRTMNLDKLMTLLQGTWHNVDFQERELQGCYQSFLVQYYFYKIIFSVTKVKKIFFVQNGIMKGVFKAAKECGVEVIEFQHGQISKSHQAYSYPRFIEKSDTRIYLPARLLTFGQYWNSNVNMPGCKVAVVGNNFYSYVNTDSLKAQKNSILVVSSMIHGEVLSNFVKQILEVKKDIFVYFKLHPNEFANKETYQKVFSEYTNVQVISDEYSIPKLLPKIENVLVVQSTVEFEALSQGKKVIVLECLDYRSLECLFEEEGVYRVKNVSDFLDIIETTKGLALSKRNDFFQAYDNTIIKKILNE